MSSRWMSKPPVGSVIDWGNPLAKGLVGAWLMNEGGGKYIKSIGRKSLDGAIGPGSWGRGTYGAEIDFTSSTSSQVEFGSSNILAGASKCSFHFLLFYKTAQTGRIIHKWGSTGAVSDYLINTTASSALQFAITNGTDYLITHSNSTLTAGKWYHIAVVWHGGTVVKFYINGLEVGTTVDTSNSIATIQFSSSNFEFGYEDWENAAGAVMKLAFVNIFKNRALSPSEIQSLYESPYQFVKGPSTITYFTAPTGGWVWGGEVKNVMVA